MADQRKPLKYTRKIDLREEVNPFEISIPHIGDTAIITRSDVSQAEVTYTGNLFKQPELIPAITLSDDQKGLVNQLMGVLLHQEEDWPQEMHKVLKQLGFYSK